MERGIPQFEGAEVGGHQAGNAVELGISRVARMNAAPEADDI